MTTRTVAALMLAALLAGACSSGSDDPEVLGVVVERSDDATEEPEPSSPEPSSSETRAAVRDAPAVGGHGLATLQAEDERPRTSAPHDPATSEPAASESSVAPATLAEGPGNTYTWTQPADPPEEGAWWVESSSLPSQDRDADPWNGARVAAEDVQRAEGEDTSTQPVRRATCEAWLEAPVDRPVSGSGTVTVELQVNGAVVASGAHAFDGTIEAGGRQGFAPVGDATVDAREGDTVTCEVRFDAD